MNKKFDINNAKKLMWYSSDSDIPTMYAVEVSLYVNQDGDYFECGEGGARTQFAKRYSDGSWGAGERVTALEKDQIVEWIYDHSRGEDNFRENIRACEKIASEYLGVVVEF